MGKRFYCDYCDKSFPYNTQNRKKHNEGGFHQMMKAAYFAQFKDLRTIIAEEESKKTCSKYFLSGFCAFGEKCRFSHKSPVEIQFLKDQYRLECHKKAVAEETRQASKEKKVRNRRETGAKMLTQLLNREDQEMLEKALPNFVIPQVLKKFEPSTLPPSLRPPTFKDLIDYEFNEWKA